MARLESLYSQQISAMASDLLAPGQVQNLVYAVEQGKVLLSWDAVTVNSDDSPLLDLSGYKVFRKKNVEDEFQELGQVGADVLEFEDNSMKDGASYIYAVCAFDDEAVPQEGMKSEDLAVKTIPSVPQGLESLAFDAKIALSWTSVQDEVDPEVNENLAGYAIYRSEVDGSDYVNIGEVSKEETSFEDETAINDVTYYYVITAFDNSL